MAKPKKDDRRAVVEQMRREQQRKERRQGLLIIGAAVLVGAIILGFAGWQIWQASEDGSDSALASYGVPAAEADCQEIAIEDAVEGASDHREEGTRIQYDTSPPAAGPHWPNFLVGNQIRPFWTTDDRPPLERLVHSLEHGHTILWYDQTIAEDEDAVEELEELAEEASQSSDTDGRFMAAPWTVADGKPFPEGAHLALTHWSVGGDGDPSGDQQGVRQYCGQLSGEVVQDFIAEYPWDDAPEPGAA